MENFVAIDFETANSNAYSPCSVGIAKFENGTLVDSFYSLINPEQEFDAMFTVSSLRMLKTLLFIKKYTLK